MTVSAAFSLFYLQSSTAETISAAARSEPGLLSSIPFPAEFLIDTAFIWATLIVIVAIVVIYRRRGKDEKRGFQDTYHEELEAMRKGRED